MRVIWLVLAACATTATAPPAGPTAPKGTAPPAASPSATPAPPASQLRARVGIDNGSWTDILVDGTDEHAREFCARLVASELIAPRGVKLRVMRDCSTDRLPPPPRAAVHFVETDEVDDDSVAISGLLAGRSPTPSQTAEPTERQRGVTLRVLPFASRLECEALIGRLDAEEHADWMANQQEEARAIDATLTEALGQRDTSCKEVASLEARCAKMKRRDERWKRCLLEVGPKQVVCNEYKRRVASLEERRSVARPRTVANRICREP